MFQRVPIKQTDEGTGVNMITNSMDPFQPENFDKLTKRTGEQVGSSATVVDSSDVRKVTSKA